MSEKLQHTRVKKVAGFDKFSRSVKKELQKLQEMKDETRQYSSTSIFYLTAIWNYCMDVGLNNIKAIHKKIKYVDVINDKRCIVIVDLITENGLKWVKIKSQNPYSIQANILKTESRSNILTVADNYVKAAKANKIKFKTPKIEFVFTKGITSDVEYMLTTKAIVCKGNVIKDDIFFLEEEEEEEEREEDEEDDIDGERKVNSNKENQETEEKKNDDNRDIDGEEINETAVNLGPKCMMTMISALANNEIHDEFWQIVEDYVIERQDHPDTYKSTIYQQALNFQYNSKLMSKIFSAKSTQMLSTMVGNYYEEIQYPVMPVIMQYIGTKKLYCCESAWKSVTRLVGMGAGPNEFNRYKQLQQQITIIPDQPSERTLKLKGKGLSDVNKAVFGTGDKLRMLTVAGAPTFVRKAKRKGVDFYCKIHDVRPFIEQYQVGFEIFKINKGFDLEELNRTMEEDDVNLDFEDDKDFEDSDAEDNKADECEEDEDADEDEDDGGFIEMHEEFENFDIQFK